MTEGVCRLRAAGSRLEGSNTGADERRLGRRAAAAGLTLEGRDRARAGGRLGSRSCILVVHLVGAGGGGAAGGLDCEVQLPGRLWGCSAAWERLLWLSDDDKQVRRCPRPRTASSGSLQRRRGVGKLSTAGGVPWEPAGGEKAFPEASGSSVSMRQPLVIAPQAADQAPGGRAGLQHDGQT